MSREDRVALAKKRITSVLTKHGTAMMRTLEMKISDAGPNNQRLEPHILTVARNEMLESGEIKQINRPSIPWFSLADTPEDRFEARFAAQESVRLLTQKNRLPLRLGQTLEISIYRALQAQQRLSYFGRYTDLDAHDDSELYRKEEPPNYIGRRSIDGQEQLDFLVSNDAGIWGGLEAKNVREWMYPNRDEVRDLLSKCVALDCVPILVARRIPYVTFYVLNKCGFIIHQNYNQLYPATASDIADQAKQKNLLGFHDIKCGNLPDQRLTKFLSENLPALLEQAKPKFDLYKDLLGAFASREMEWPEFSARARRRATGEPEDGEWAEEDMEPDEDLY